MMTHEPHLTPLELDLFDLGQASPEAAARIEQHGARCAACAARRAEHAASMAHFREVVFPRRAGALRARRSGWPSLAWSFGLALPLAAVAVFLILPRPSSTDHGSAGASIGIKGGPGLQVFVRRHGVERAAAEVTKVQDGDRLAPGDALRFVLSPSDLPFVLIASVDGAGQVSVYYPYQGEASIEVAPAATVVVPGSIVLDQTPGPERVFVIRSAKPVATSVVRTLLARLGAGGADEIRSARQLPMEGTVQSTLLFEKETGR
jgi:hypothetical protein